MMTSDPAAPYADATAVRPRYSPIRDLPAVNRTAVTAAPSQTLRQASVTSGRNLKIRANMAATTTVEKTAFTVSSSAAGTDSTLPTNVPMAAIHALTARETSKRNPTPTTIANDQNRSLTITRTPRPGFVVTPQTVLRASCSSPNRPHRPKSKVTTPRVVGSKPPPSRRTLSIVAC